MALLTQLLSMKASHFMSEAAIAVDGICIQIFFDTEELVVLSYTFASCRSAVLIWPAFRATAMSAMVVSAVSPERWEMTAV